MDYTYIALDSVPKIVKDFENPTIPTENNLSNNNAIATAVTEMANSLNAEI